MVFCTKCGSKETGRFCSKCGHPLTPPTGGYAPPPGSSASKSSEDICPKCSKEALFSEDTIVSGGVKYHRTCFGYQHVQPKTSNIQKDDACPKCGEIVKHETDSIISAGKSYHRACFDLKPQVVRQNSISYVESCPTCKEPVSKGSNDVAPDIIISGGNQYHRKCFEIKTTEPKVLNIVHDEICEKCGKTVSQKAAKGDTAADVIISGGKQFHRSCLELNLEKQPSRTFIQEKELCPQCQNEITSKERSEAVYKMGKPYHRECYYASQS